MKIVTRWRRSRSQYSGALDSGGDLAQEIMDLKYNGTNEVTLVFQVIVYRIYK